MLTSFFMENIATIAVLFVVAVIVGLVIFKLVRDKKRGKPSCNCGCGGCPMRDTCHSKETK
ncbi:MAG: FeoB-associated Cys-rich membrane protein [Ruminococcus sp.]|nr:FeoB-associated Cys-rich membrane protein [Ruminococcus sp.]